MLNAKLLVVGGDAKISEFELRLPTVIGRGREASLTLPHPLVSRQHTEIFEQDGRLMVRDLGSLNGTFVNNQRIESPQVLEPNQLLTLGNVTFRAVYDSVDLSQQSQLVGSQVVEVSGGVARASQETDTKAAADDEIADSVEADAAGGSGLMNVSLNRKASDVDDSLNALDDLCEDFSRDSVSSSSRLGGLPEPASSVSTIDPDEFQFDEGGSGSTKDPSQSALDSFVKKLPR